LESGTGEYSPLLFGLQGSQPKRGFVTATTKGAGIVVASVGDPQNNALTLCIRIVPFFGCAKQ